MFIYTCFFNETKGWTHFFLAARFLGGAILLARPIGQAKKMGAQNQSARPIETQQEALLFVPFYLNSSYSFIVNVFPSKVFTMRLFQSERCFNVQNKQLRSRCKRKAKGYFFKLLWGRGCTIRCASKTIFIIQTHPSQSAQKKNTLKTWTFTKNKLCQRCFDNNLLKISKQIS